MEPVKLSTTQSRSLETSFSVILPVHCRHFWDITFYPYSAQDFIYSIHLCGSLKTCQHQLAEAPPPATATTTTTTDTSRRLQHFNHPPGTLPQLLIQEYIEQIHWITSMLGSSFTMSPLVGYLNISIYCDIQCRTLTTCQHFSLSYRVAARRLTPLQHLHISTPQYL